MWPFISVLLFSFASKAITSEVLGADLMLLARRLVGPAVPSGQD
jgi:hypothetical protein